MELTVVVCTYNRSRMLRQCLASLRRQEPTQPRTWEILVVDNNCADDTAAVVAEAAGAFPVPVRLARERQQGLSHARNRGIEAALGRYVAFIDDDALAAPGWVEALLDSFAHHECAAVGGPIDLAWEAPRPGWLTDELLGFLGWLDHGPAERPLDRDHPLHGGNMAFERAIFEKIGTFDPDLGRQGRAVTGGEEMELLDRLLDGGFTGMWQPRALVHHVIEGHRLRRSFFRRLHYHSGRQRGERLKGRSARTVAGVPLYLFPQLWRSISAFGRAGLRDGFHRSMRKEMTVWYFVGFIVGAAAGARAGDSRGTCRTA